MDFLNRGSPERVHWRHARNHSLPDIYALLMHRKHFASIAVTMDLIVYRQVNLQTTRFAGLRTHRPWRCFRPARCVSDFFLHVHPLCAFDPLFCPFCTRILRSKRGWPTARMFLLTVLYNWSKPDISPGRRATTK